jgi:hypothetical protein
LLRHLLAVVGVRLSRLMSANPSVPGGAGPVTRLRAAAGVAGATPPSVVDPTAPQAGPRPLSSSTLTDVSPDLEEDDAKQLNEFDEATESKAESHHFAEWDEFERVRLREAQLDVQMKELELRAMKKRVMDKERAIAAAYAELDGGKPPPSLSVAALTMKSTGVVVGKSAVVSVNQTPTRQSLRPQRLFQSTVGRKAPTAAAIQYKASVDSLPDLEEEDADSEPVSSGRPLKEAAPPAVEVRVSRSAVKPKPVQPEKFTGDDATQNERVEGWIDAVNVWLQLSGIEESDHLVWAKSLVATSSSASEWLRQRNDELRYEKKSMTWAWLQVQLIQHYGQPSGPVAVAAEWQALRMGVKNADGSETGGKATWTVAAYTALFLKCMRQLTTHSIQTTEVVIIDRYVAGIKQGYETLWRVMLGVQQVLWYDTLMEAIDGAENAEAAIKVSHLDKRTNRAASSWESAPGSSPRRNNRGKRQSTQEALNNVEGSSKEEGQGEDSTMEAPTPSAPSEPTRVYGFVYRGAGPKDGRYPCNEAEAKIIFDNGQCYRCQTIHPVGVGTPRCTKPPCKTAPKKLLK